MDLRFREAQRIARVRAFYEVREIPYATGGSHEPQDLLSLGRGNCAAKAALLAQKFAELGYLTQRLIGRYRLRDWPEEVEVIPDRVDYHHALEVEIEGTWVFVDPSYDSPLAGLGFRINEWDGLSSTAWGEDCSETKRCVDVVEDFDERFRGFVSKLDDAFRSHSERVVEYSTKFNEILDRFRRGKLL